MENLNIKSFYEDKETGSSLSALEWKSVMSAIETKVNEIVTKIGNHDTSIASLNQTATEHKNSINTWVEANMGKHQVHVILPKTLSTTITGNKITFTPEEGNGIAIQKSTVLEAHNNEQLKFTIHNGESYKAHIEVITSEGVDDEQSKDMLTDGQFVANITEDTTIIFKFIGLDHPDDVAPVLTPSDNTSGDEVVDSEDEAQEAEQL